MGDRCGYMRSHTGRGGVDLGEGGDFLLGIG